MFRPQPRRAGPATGLGARRSFPMSLIVSSIASTALRTRLATSCLAIIGMVPSSDMPVA